MADDRVERERAFHDEEFEDERRAKAGMDQFYAVGRRREQRYDRKVVEGGRTGDVLEYGCGSVAHAAILIAGSGRPVTAIDLSGVAIEKARSRAVEAGVADRIDFRVMNAQELEFPDDSFDFVCGAGILHHLDLSAALHEIVRVLRPGGRAFFSEPLSGNPAIDAYRRRTPDLRSADEQPLRLDDLALFEDYFQDVERTYFHLASLAAIPLRRRPALFRRAVSVLDAADRGLLRVVPGLGRFAWFTQIELGSPRKDVTASRTRSPAA